MFAVIATLSDEEATTTALLGALCEMSAFVRDLQAPKPYPFPYVHGVCLYLARVTPKYLQELIAAPQPLQ
ncbi:MAG: hypothetical protein JST84_05125 [Acidobacteria bacterium]|nr:hypothetical protein [Acidobacteriota bacterium]